MGFYVFRTDVLIERLLADAEAAGSKHDFGGDVVPKMIADGDRVYGYRFDGYWRDVGTIQSYHDAHMELLTEPPALDLYDRGWPIHTKTEGRPPGLVGSGAHVVQSLISHGCRIHGHVERSVLSPGVLVEEGAIVRDSIVLFDAAIGAGAVVDRAVIDKEVVIGPSAYIGFGDDIAPNETEPGRLNTGITLVGKRAQVPYGVRMGRNCRIDPDVDSADFTLADLPSGTTVTHRNEQ
jgi:glucose-1-phosphate adenylyltransferase